jgi:hypothetical protein
MLASGDTQSFLFLFHIQSSTNTTTIKAIMTENGLGIKISIPRYNPIATQQKRLTWRTVRKG